ncbi:MAG: hypothetical protein H6627_05100 [Calditrichae bacterium]|nr:hypothetical protein [Calditrichia bacterium]
MNSLQAIKINAIYEIKILIRSWFFRLFAIAAMLVLTGLDILFFSTISPVPRFMSGMNSFLPYMNILLPHFSQLIVLVFLTTDLYKRDKKLNTSDVIHIRDMSNFSFLFGRIIGIIILFLGLDIVFILIAALFNLFFSDLMFVWQAYLLYPFVLALPAIVFSVGFTLLLMFIIRNQPVVIVLVIGLLAGSVFYFSKYAFLVFDIIPAKLAFTYSDFTGLADFNLLLIQRLIWLFSGLFMIFLSVLFFKRLPQSGISGILLKILTVLFPVVIGGLFYVYVDYYQSGVELREKARKQISEYEQTAQITDYDIQLDKQGDILFGSANLAIVNISGKDLDSLQFFLNPGLQVKELLMNNSKSQFKQNGIILTVMSPDQFKAGDSASLKIEYNGRIDDRFMYSNIEEKERSQTNFIWLYRMKSRFAYVTNKYMLLPPSAYWYPQTNSSDVRDLSKPFANFNLTVGMDNNLTAVSQGKADTLENGTYRFIPEYPLKEISLVAGNFEKQTVWVDSLRINLFKHPDHNYYKPYFKVINDTLPAVIKDLLQGFETKVDLNYPFRRLNLIEVPIHTFAYMENNRENSIFLQPEQVWVPENAANLQASYFKFMQERQQRFGSHSNQTFTDLEKEIMLFKRFVRGTFSGDDNFGRDSEIMSFNPNLNVYPLFLNFSFGLTAAQTEGFAIALEANLKQSSSGQGPPRHWMVGYLTDSEEANLALAKASMDSILKYAKNDLVNKVVMEKGGYLLKQIKYELGDKYERFIKNLISGNRFKSVPVSNVSDTLLKDYNFNLRKAVASWYKDDKLPGFIFSGFDQYQVRDGDRLRYQVVFVVYNPSETDGIIEVEFRYPGEGRRRFEMEENTETEKWLFKIAAGEAREFGLVLDAEARAIRINTLISRNLPSDYTYMFDDPELKENKKPFEGSEKIDWVDYTKNQDILIADNINDQFDYVSPQYRSRLKAWIHKDAQEKENEYDYFRWWRGPAQWQKLKFPSLYGEFVHSAYYARTGSGERTATWVTQIVDPGFYQVFVHVPDQSDFRSGRRESSSFGVQKYKIYHSEGVDEIEIDFSSAPAGWNYLETYYFNPGEAKIVLTDEGNGSMVLADAVKWELKE